MRRWLGRALAVGVPLGGAVQLRMHGHIRLGGRWRAFVADQVLAPPRGFVWAATARFGALPVTGFDRYSGGTGEMRWKLMNLLPVVTATGADVTTSAAGRLAAEVVLAPTAFASATWEATEDPDVARGSFHFPHGAERVELRLASDGQVQSASMMRWGSPDGLPFARHPFGAELSDSATFDGLTIPTTMRVGWAGEPTAGTTASSSGRGSRRWCCSASLQACGPGDARPAAIRAVVAALSPVSMTTRTPLVCQVHLAAGDINGERVEHAGGSSLADGVPRPGAGSTQHHVHAGEELARAERLRRVVVRAHREPDELVDLLAGRGQHDGPRTARHATHLDTVKDRQAHAEHHDVRVDPARQVRR